MDVTDLKGLYAEVGKRMKAALDHLRAQGVRVIDEHGRPGSRGTTIAFVHPKSMDGVPIELVQVND